MLQARQYRTRDLGDNLELLWDIGSVAYVLPRSWKELDISGRNEFLESPAPGEPSAALKDGNDFILSIIVPRKSHVFVHEIHALNYVWRCLDVCKEDQATLGIFVVSKHAVYCLTELSTAALVDGTCVHPYPVQILPFSFIRASLNFCKAWFLAVTLVVEIQSSPGMKPLGHLPMYVREWRMAVFAAHWIRASAGCVHW